jgi:methylated-DNA-protein-cysteine methyltransferase-like protein
VIPAGELTFNAGDSCIHAIVHSFMSAKRPLPLRSAVKPATRARQGNPQHAAFLAVIGTIPPGWVMSYGAIARAAGLPRHARHVGVALKQLPDGDATPWWRVVNGEGRVSPRGFDGSDERQRLLLEEEGVMFGENGRIDLKRFGWGG